MASNKYVRYKKVMQALPKSEIEMYREIFNYFDRNKKGYLVADDFAKVLASMNQNPTQEEIQDLLQTHDVNGDGKITFEEMVVVTVKRKKYTDDESDVKKIFRKFDKNNDGNLSRQELGELLTAMRSKLKVSNSTVDDVMRSFDENKDEVIQYEEFVKMLHNWKIDDQDDGKDDDEKEDGNEEENATKDMSSDKNNPEKQNSKG